MRDTFTIPNPPRVLSSLTTLTPFTSAGTTVFVVPRGVTQILAEVWGAGGGGAGGTAGASQGAGGGGGGYARSVLTVIPGMQLQIIVGSGGTGGGASGGNGTPSLIAIPGQVALIRAEGGVGANPQSTGGTGGAGTGTVAITGQPGGNSSATVAGSGGGAWQSPGALAPLVAPASGPTGPFPGSAGAGGLADAVTSTGGGTGATGLVLLFY